MNLDYDILIFFKSIHNPILDLLFKIITYLGEYMIIWIVITIYLIIKYHKKELFKYIAIIYSISYIVNDIIIKNIFQRPRPFVTYPIFETIIKEPTSFSFPSGHSASSFTAATILSYYFPKYRVLFNLLAFLVAVSRLYLNVHYPSDVLVGMLVGYGIARASILIMEINN